MSTRKPAAKAAPAPKPPEAATGPTGPLFNMPQEVSDWIERAQSIMAHQKGQIDRLKAENTELKSYKRWAEQRILGMSNE